MKKRPGSQIVRDILSKSSRRKVGDGRGRWWWREEGERSRSLHLHFFVFDPCRFKAHHPEKGPPDSRHRWKSTKKIILKNIGNTRQKPLKYKGRYLGSISFLVAFSFVKSATLCFAKRITCTAFLHRDWRMAVLGDITVDGFRRVLGEFSFSFSRNPWKHLWRRFRGFGGNENFVFVGTAGTVSEVVIQLD